MDGDHRSADVLAGGTQPLGLGRRRLWAALLGAGICVLFLAGPSRAAAPHGAAGARIAWKACGERLQCARVRVPLDWSHPQGRQISLPVIRYLATGPGRRIGALFLNSGGGLGSVETVRTDGAAFADQLGGGRFDVVGWALRGTAGAEPRVRCFADQRSRHRFWGRLSLPTTPAQGRAYLPKTISYARRCGTLSGRALAHVSTADDARDLDRLRELVGDRRLTYRGASYGTFLGQTYANLFPHRVRAMTLDGLLDPRVVVKGSAARFGNGISAMDRVLNRFESLCESAGPGRCALAGDGPVTTRVSGLLARLRRAPIPAPSAQPPGALTFGDVLLPMFAGSQDPGMWPQLAQDLDQAADGDGSALATRGRAALAGSRSADGDSAGAVACADSPAREGPHAWPRVIARLTRLSQIGGPVVGWGSWASCASSPVRNAERYTGPWDRTTEHPVLVIGTTSDPSTPYANARAVAKLLGNAVLLTHDGYGHTSGADPSACVVRATESYLVDLTTPPRGAVCPSDHQPFDPDFGQAP